MKSVGNFMNKQITHLREIRDAPEAVAGGIAIGMFFGFTPFFGVKTLLAIAVAWVFRCSKLAAAIAVTLHDLLIPIAPFVLWIEYKVGYWMITRPHQWPKAMHLGHVSLAEFLDWTNFIQMGKPLIIGSLLVGAIFALISYTITHRLLIQLEEKHHMLRPKIDE